MSAPRARADWHYLAYAGQVGNPSLHPFGRGASDCLIAALDVGPGERVLEIGCGTGWTLLRLALSADVCVDGADLLAPMVETARRRRALAGAASRVGLLRADGCALPFRDGSYHRVYTESVLGFQDEAHARGMLAEVYRVLRPGGRYVANEAVWRAGASPQAVSQLVAAGIADFGVAVASPQPWADLDWLRVMGEVGFRDGATYPLPARGGRVSRAPFLHSLRLALAALPTVAGMARARLLPSLAARRLMYRRRFGRRWPPGAEIEARLFVLER